MYEAYKRAPKLIILGIFEIGILIEIIFEHAVKPVDILHVLVLCEHAMLFLLELLFQGYHQYC